MTDRTAPLIALLILLTVVAGCGRRTPQTAASPPPAGPSAFPAAPGEESTAARPPAPPPLTEENVRSTPLDSWDAQPIDVINGPDSPLKPVFFAYDREDLSDEARQTLNANAEVLKRYSTWVITIEGHCDERGTAEYNLALGDRRALAAKNYLLSLGIASDRLRTVSYGKEFPFNPGSDEAAWAMNRRAHFMLTSK